MHAARGIRRGHGKEAERNHMASSSACPPGLLLALHRRAELVRGHIEAGRRPSPAQTAQFIRETVGELGPHIRSGGCPARAARALKEGLSGVGWHVQTNSPAAGSAGPPSAEELLKLFDGSFATLRPTLPAAQAAVQAAAAAGRWLGCGIIVGGWSRRC
eukprot:COSAG01_NODE_7963_length_2974_cov_2.990609_4_plen_159_part_00